MEDYTLIETLVKKVDGVADDVRTNTYRLDKIEARFDRLDENIDALTTVVKEMSGELRTLSGQFNAVGSKVIVNDKRLDNLEARVAVLEAVGQ